MSHAGAIQNSGECGGGVTVLFEHLMVFREPEPGEPAPLMAADEWFLLHTRVPLLRIYRWKYPAVSFGCFQPLAGALEFAGGRPVVRRWTGGGFVEHGEDWTYALVLPGAWPPGFARCLYAAVHRALAAALPEAQLAPETDAHFPGNCFQAPVGSDLMLDGRKIAGAAQRRIRAGLLQQGSVRVPPGLNGGQWLATSIGSLAAGWEAFNGQVPTPFEVEESVRNKYGSQDWLKRF